MDITAQEAVDALRPLLGQARAVTKLVAVLDKLVSLENHQAELEKGVARLQATKASLEDDIGKATVEAEGLVANAIERANKIVQAAQADAAITQRQAEQIGTQLRATLAQERLEADTAIAPLAAQRDDLLLDIEVQTSRRDALLAEIAATKDRLAPLVG